MKSLFIAAAVAACASSRVLAQDMGEMPNLGDLSSLLDGMGDIDLGALEELGKQMEEASKNCDTEKLGALSEACGQSMSAQMKTCTDECKEMFKFMGEADGCGDLYDQLGLGDIEQVCNGADLSDIVTDVPMLPVVPVTDAAGTTMPSPASTPESATNTNTPALPENIAEIAPETTSGSLAGAMVAAGVAILAIV